MSVGRWRWFVAAAAVSAALSAGPARAQYGRYLYPRGYGEFGWNGWGGGGQTVQGNVASGFGAYAAGAGTYNQETAQARAMNADTVMRWNQYMYASQLEANRRERARQLRRKGETAKSAEALYKRLRDNPEQADIHRGDALNVALEQLSDPRVSARAIQAAGAKLGGEVIREIPFQHATGAVAASIHQVTQSPPPDALMTRAFESDRLALKEVGPVIREQIERGEKPDPAAVKRAIFLVEQAETKVARVYARKPAERRAADQYLKAVHGLLVMMQTPALDLLLSGVEKQPDATLGQLLTFMNSFNLRFGPATNARQQAAYDRLFPLLDALRDQFAATQSPAPASTAAAGPEAAGEFLSGIGYDDLKKKATSGNEPK
ncbi:MAG: hypothetical protein U0835_17600 [Isosphaeraceae bacterium]